MAEAKEFGVAEEAHQDASVPNIRNMDPERRKQVEKSLKRKLDARCSLFVLIYIMVCLPSSP